MLDIGWTELLLVGVVALLVIGPRDLPGALRAFGKFVGQLRSMARQFQDGLDDIAKQEDLRDLQRSVSSITRPGAIDRYLKSDIDDAAKPLTGPDASEPAEANSIAGNSMMDGPDRIESAAGETDSAPTASSDEGDEPDGTEPTADRQPDAADSAEPPKPAATTPSTITPPAPKSSS